MNAGSNKKDHVETARESIYNGLKKIKHDTDIKLFMESGHTVAGKFISISHRGDVYILISGAFDNNSEARQIFRTHTHYIHAFLEDSK